MKAWRGSGKKRQRRARVADAARPSSDRRNAAVRDAHGRLHLVVHQVAAGGQPFVTLEAPLFRESWQNELTASAANSALAALQDGVNEQRVVQLARQAMAATSQLADGLLAQAPNGAVACKAGCDHCCHQSVGVTTAEALAIVDHLRRTLSPEGLALVTQRFAVARERTQGLSSEQRYAPEYPCPFLHDSQCSIYDARPLSCRGMNALDAEECKANLRDPEARAEFLKQGGGRSFMEPIRAFHAISAGIQLGLSELYHLDMRPLDLTAAVHELLSGPASLTDEWLSGKPSLARAQGGDSTGSLQIQRLSGALPGSD